MQELSDIRFGNFYEGNQDILWLLIPLAHSLDKRKSSLSLSLSILLDSLAHRTITYGL